MLILRQALVVALVGVGIGLGGAIAVSQVMSSLLFHVDPTDASTLAVIAAGLGAVALLASHVPPRGLRESILSYHCGRSSTTGSA